MLAPRSLKWSVKATTMARSTLATPWFSTSRTGCLTAEHELELGVFSARKTHDFKYQTDGSVSSVNPIVAAKSSSASEQTIRNFNTASITR